MNIFEVERTEQNLYEIVNEYRMLLSIPSDIEIKIKWGRKAKRVLGSVRLHKGKSVVLISKYLSDYNVPDYILHEVILHELIHVKTGHGSVLQKQYQNAHRGGVIRKEMEAVGKQELYDLSDLWIKKNWYKHVRSYNIRERKRKI